MWKPDICVYHGGCDDGFGAAWAIWHRWPDCEFVPGSYGKPVGVDIAGRNLLMVDFSYKRAEIEAMAKEAKSVVIIDHHKTARADLEPFKLDMNPIDKLDVAVLERVLATFDHDPAVAWFDMNQSGAPMAFKFAYPDAIVPEMLKLIEDRDLWRFQYGDRTRQFSAALRTYPQEFEVWDQIAGDVERVVKDGEIVLRAHRALLERFLKQAYWTNISGYRVPVLNVPYDMASDAGHELLKLNPDAPFVGTWWRMADGSTAWSLRSEDKRIDVGMIASKMGGGGHRNAAGFGSKVE